MKKVVGCIPGRCCTDLYCARGAQGVLPCKGWGLKASQLNLPSLSPVSVAGCDRLKLEVPIGLLQ